MTAGRRVAICECVIGFEKDADGHCKDVDECRTDQHQCSKTCINTVGSYKCRGCHQGYFLENGMHCRARGNKSNSSSLHKFTTV